MSETIGIRGFKEEQYSKNYSESTQQVIDAQVHRIISEATEKCRATVRLYS